MASFMKNLFLSTFLLIVILANTITAFGPKETVNVGSLLKDLKATQTTTVKKEGIKEAEIQWANVDEMLPRNTIKDRESLIEEGKKKLQQQNEMHRRLQEAEDLPKNPEGDATATGIEYLGSWIAHVCSEAYVALDYLGFKSSTHQFEPAPRTIHPGKCESFEFEGMNTADVRMYFDSHSTVAEKDQEIDFTIRLEGHLLSDKMVRTSATYLSAHSNVIASRFESTNNVVWVNNVDGMNVYYGDIQYHIDLVSPGMPSGGNNSTVAGEGTTK